jgi:methylated-DNA-[protein]-cysteine S-methyltransferase
MKTLQFERIGSPIGEIVIVVDGGRLAALDYADYEPRMLKLLHRRYGSIRLEETRDAGGFRGRVDDYFAGDYTSLDAIPIATGGTAFQQQVWTALRAIPPGTTLTYGQLAAKAGRPTAFRAAGAANALNPVAIVVPCHRVVGADASLTGYAGGLQRKQWLLRHEGAELERRARQRGV